MVENANVGGNNGDDDINGIVVREATKDEVLKKASKDIYPKLVKLIHGLEERQCLEIPDIGWYSIVSAIVRTIQVLFDRRYRMTQNKSKDRVVVIRDV